MTEGIWPKADGDVFFASEANNLRVHFQSGGFIGSTVNSSTYAEVGSFVIPNAVSGILLGYNYFNELTGDGVGIASQRVEISGTNTGKWNFDLTNIFDDGTNRGFTLTLKEDSNRQSHQRFDNTAIVVGMNAMCNIPILDDPLVIKVYGKVANDVTGVCIIGTTTYNLTFAKQMGI